jgi:hypothetical protein
MSRFQMQYPTGSLRSINEIKNLLLEAKKGAEITLYAVEQLGYISKYLLTPDSKYIPNDDSDLKGPQYDKVTCFVYQDDTRQYWYHILMGSYNLNSTEDNYCGVHRLFTDQLLAETYSNELKNDAEYVEEVRRHHERCKDLYDEDLYEDEDYYY